MQKDIKQGLGIISHIYNHQSSSFRKISLASNFQKFYKNKKFLQRIESKKGILKKY